MRGAWWWLIAALLLVSVALQLSLLFLMTMLLALVGGASQLWSRYCLSEVSYVRRFGATRLFFGDETTLDVEITNAKPLPLPWLRADDEIPGSLAITGGHLTSSHRPQRQQLVNLLSLRWYERVTRHYHLRGSTRGAWTYGPVTVSAEDIFGFTVRTKSFEQTQTVLVYPKLVPVTTLGLPAQHPFGDYRTSHRVLEDPIRQMGAREYAPGDNYRYIHWKATARRATLQTKIFEPSASRPLAIFLNVNTFEHIWQGIDRPLQELAITAAASIARYGWENSYAVGLYANTVANPGAERIRIRPGTHPDQLSWVLDACASLVDFGRWPIEMVMQAEAEHLGYGTTVVVVTSLLLDSLKSTMMELRRREHAVVLILLGEARCEDAPPGVVCYHIGGRETWDALESIKLA
jgi:uncharacterized protein (DUF58 family)